MKKDTKKKPKKLTAKEFDRIAEAGSDLADQFDWDTGTTRRLPLIFLYGCSQPLWQRLNDRGLVERH